MAHDADSLDGLPKVGTIIAGKYVRERVLAVGGMGAVMSATDEALDRKVAIKFMLPKALDNPEVRTRFLREARSAVTIRSEHVVDIYEVGVAPPNVPFIVMEYLPGKDLHRFLETTRGNIPIPEAVDYVLQACEALAAAHALGIVHRDIKPSNLFLTPRVDGSGLVKVLDFGISKATGVRFESHTKSLTQSSVALGSPLYMSPEQVRNSKSVDVRTDIWSIGIVLYELLTKSLPFDGETVPSLAAAIASDPPRPLRDARPDVPPELEDVVAKCLVKDPAQRYQTIGAFARALAPFAPPGRRAISYDSIEANVSPMAFQSTTEQRSPLSVDEREQITLAAQPTGAGTTAGLGTTQRVAARRRRSMGLVFVGGIAAAGAVVAFLTLRPSEPPIEAVKTGGAPSAASTTSPAAPELEVPTTVAPLAPPVPTPSPLASAATAMPGPVTTGSTSAASQGKIEPPRRGTKPAVKVTVPARPPEKPAAKPAEPALPAAIGVGGR